MRLESVCPNPAARRILSWPCCPQCRQHSPWLRGAAQWPSHSSRHHLQAQARRSGIPQVPEQLCQGSTATNRKLTYDDDTPVADATVLRDRWDHWHRWCHNSRHNQALLTSRQGVTLLKKPATSLLQSSDQPEFDNQGATRVATPRFERWAPGKQEDM